MFLSRRILILAIAVLSSVPVVASGQPQSRFTLLGPIVISVRRNHVQLEYRVDDKRYLELDLASKLRKMNEETAPMLRQRKEDVRDMRCRQVYVMIDESASLGDVLSAPQIAKDAGFTDITALAVFQRNHSMAEISLRHVQKISSVPDLQ